MILYLDEAGCPGELPSAISNVEPVFSILGLVMQERDLRKVTFAVLDLKKKYRRHGRPYRYLDLIDWEIKGSDLRKDIAVGSSSRRRAAIWFLDCIVRLAERYQMKLIGRVWVKPIAAKFDGRAIYTSSVQSICSAFQDMMKYYSKRGFIIADSRNKYLNTSVAHSVFTQKYQAAGDSLDNMREMPVFGHSNNHAGLQIADLLVSAIVSPIAIESYCKGHISSVHIRDYNKIKSKFSSRIRNLQYRYNINGKWTGGIVICDGISRRPGSLFFR